MRLERIRIAAFGPVEDWCSGEEALPELVAVLGPNESGKSSLFRAVCSLLHGIYPTSREDHPYAPWSGRDMEIAADVRLDSGEAAEVRRRLLSSPRAEVTREGAVTSFGNDTLSWARHVPRKLFGEVYALTLQELAALPLERWQEVEERLLGSLGARDLRPVRKVVEELESEAEGLWRPDRRGKPESKRLAKRRRELLEARREARERDREVREAAERRAEVEEALRENREARIHLGTRIRRMETLGPVRERLLRIGEEEARRGDPSELEGLPADPLERLEGLERSAGETGMPVERLEERAGDVRAKLEAPDEADEAVLGRGDEIRALVREAGEVGFAVDRLQRVEARGEELERSCRERAGELFSVSWDRVDREALSRTSLREIQALVARHGERAREAERLRSALASLESLDPGPAPSPFPLTAAVLGGAALALVLWGVAGGPVTARLAPEIVVLMGVALGTGAGVIAWQWVRERRTRAEALERHRERLREARSSLGEAEAGESESLAEVRRALEPLPVISVRLDAPGPDLVRELEDFRSAATELENVRNEAEELEGRIERFLERAAEVGRAFEMDLPPRPAGVATALEGILREAEERKALRDKLRDDLAVVEADLEAARESHARTVRELEALRDRLAPMGGGDAEAGARAAAERLAAGRRARDLLTELEARHPELDDLRREIREAEAAGEDWTREEGWSRDQEALVRARAELEELDREEKGLIAREKELEHRIEALGREETLDRVDGALERLEEESREVRRRRDRLAVLAELLRRADGRFREENQPDLLRRASDHLARITGGRYDRILVQEADLGRTLLLKGPGREMAREVDTPLSTGTREQVYLALRLAIVDHLDADAETLPLFVDEALVNWDRGRRDRGLDLLRELSGERQFFVFTCHEETAGALEARGGRVLRLPDPP